MDDRTIVELLFARSEDALSEIAHKYSPLYRGVIRHVLCDEGDVEECESDVLLALWNSIPPNRPTSLPAYISTIARRIGIGRLRHKTSKKRSAAYTVTLSELEDCLPAEADASLEDDFTDTVREVLTKFLESLDGESEILFVRRYFYLETVAELSRRFSTDENKISVKLYRARKKLRKLLEKEGIRI